MNLDELRAVQSKERQTDSLQALRPSFYREVGDYISELEAERDRVAAEVDDPFSSPEVGRLTDEIETARDVVEAVYERRMGKLVKQASLAAAGMPADADGLTAEEEALFDDLVDRIETNKARVLEVLDGETPADDERPGSDTGADADERAADGTHAATADGTRAETDESGATGGSPRVSAADVMGDGPASDADADERATPPEPSAADDPEPRGSPDPERDPGAEPGIAGRGDPGGEPPGDSAPAGARSPDADGAIERANADGEVNANRESTDDAVDADRANEDDADRANADDDDAAVDRVTVRITRDVGSILGVDDREYTLASDDVVTLPEQNADPLVERDAAEPLE